MGRSATLCGGKGGGIITPLNWSVIRVNRTHVNSNLESYLSSAPCVPETSLQMHKPGAYLYELSRAFVSILIEELEQFRKATPHFWSSVSFGRIYAELWRQATLLDTQCPEEQSTRLNWIGAPSQESLSIQELQKLNLKWSEWTCTPLEQDLFLHFANNLSRAYLLAYEECRAAAAKSDAVAIKHHTLILGDIFEEMLALHATLMPAKNRRISIAAMNDGNGVSMDGAIVAHDIKLLDVNYVEFDNSNDFSINLHIDWIETPNAFMNTVVPPETTIQIEFGSHKGRICHRNDGGTHKSCPLDSPVAKAGDYYILEAGGGYSG